MDATKSCQASTSTIKISTNCTPAILMAATTSPAPTTMKNGRERKWKSKNGERLRDHLGFRLRASGVCVRRSEINGELEVLLVSAQRGPNAWTLPGGGVELGEQINEAVIREVEEEAGIQADIVELIGEFKDHERLHRTALFLLSPVNELHEWQDGKDGRLRCWLRYSEALTVVKPNQRLMIEQTAYRIAEIEKTAMSAR
ncbi:Nudix hydrolase domain-containing protein [Aphelenchoides besseyi]|nr:Nudix hydrolase domain-containing protein [Aphelenchoides besseyi]KAI6207561.1 Nudix hydrolase domain-containing protein [Aphelenchoides besseyi]